MIPIASVQQLQQSCQSELVRRMEVVSDGLHSILNSLLHWSAGVSLKILGIRASVDALCRDGTSEISRDPRTKRLQTRRESLARPSKHTNNNF